MSKRSSIPSNRKGPGGSKANPMPRLRIEAVRRTRRNVGIALALVALGAFVAATVILRKAGGDGPPPAPGQSANPVMGMLDRKDQAQAAKSALNLQTWAKEIQMEVANRQGELSGYQSFAEVQALLDSAQADPSAAADLARRGAPALAAFRDELAAEPDPARKERNRLLLENLGKVLGAAGK